MIFARIVQGDPRRRSRLHDFDGNRVSSPGLVDLVPSIWTTLLLRVGVRSWSPWLPFPLVRHLNRLLAPSWNVLEFGSGASTVWLANRVANVVSHEHNPEWYARVQAKLKTSKYQNVRLSLLTSSSEYASVEAYGERMFDLVLIDGHWRDVCAESAVRAVRPGGLIYFDNSDVPDLDHRLAVNTILKAAAEARRFVGFCPGHVAASQGLLIRTPAVS